MEEPQTTAPEAGGNDARAAVLAGLESLEAEAEAPAVEEVPAEEAPEEAPEEEAPSEEDEAPEESADEAEGDDEEPEEEAEAEPAEEDAQTEDDPKLSARLERIQSEEKRAKERVQGLIAEERDKFERERNRWERENAPRIEKADRFDKIASEVRYDPIGVLTELGLSDDDYEPVARALYAHSKAGAENPALRDQAARSLRERRYADELAETRKELQAIRQEREQERETAIQREAADRYLSSVEQSVGEDAPILQRLVAEDKAEAYELFRGAALQLLDETGEEPEPAEVVARVEKFERAKLKKRGIDPTTLVGSKKTKTQPAGETKAAKTLSNDLSKRTKPRRSPKTRDEEVADVKRALLSGQLE